VVAFCADLGQGEELITVRDKARKTGAVAVHIVDLRETFRARLHLPDAAGRGGLRGRLPARHVDRAAAHRPGPGRGGARRGRRRGGPRATGKGNDQVRFELTYAALAPQLKVIAPWREWELNSRTALIEFARAHDIAVPVTAERPYSMDRNLFHVSYEGGILEDPWAEPPAKMYLLTQSPEDAPDVPILHGDRVRAR